MMWHYGQTGPGGGSLPGWIARVGQIAPFDPQHVRHDIVEENVERAVRVPVAYPPGVAEYQYPAPPWPSSRICPASAAASTQGAYLGADDAGRPVRHYDVPGVPSQPQALRAAEAIKSVARLIRKHGLQAQVPTVVGGPLASLARGEAVILRWSNGVSIQAAL